MSDGISAKQFVGVHLHLHRSVICRIDERGQQLDRVQIDNDPKALVKAVRAAGRGAPVAVEATYGWYWAVDALQAGRFEVHLAHPSGMKAMRKRKRVKTDAKDAYELANLLRLGSLPEGYIAPKELGELRELVRHRRQLTKTATSVKAQIRALLAKHGVRLPASCLESQAGQDQLDAVVLPECAASRLDSRRRLMMILDNEIDTLDVELDRRLKTHEGYRNLLKVKGIGPVLAAIFVVEIGDVSRFGTAEQLACWAGITPGTTSPTGPCGAATSARRAAPWSAGRRSKRCSVSANRRSPRSARTSWPAAAGRPATSRRSRPAARCSRPSSTSCATARPTS